METIDWSSVWSREIQGVQTLYQTRKLRFSDPFAEGYRRLFRLDAARRLRILEVGCGPGALSGALRRWYPRAEIAGIDRDRAFIRFAAEREAGIDFREGDAERLPFPDESFDVTISHTVHEHVEPGAFWGEQWRVLRPGGVCLCLSVRKSIVCTAPCLAETEIEWRFWEALPEDADRREAVGVGRYATDEAALPADMERHGFVDVTTGYVVADLTPDDPKYPPHLAQAMIEAERLGALEAIVSTRSPEVGPVMAAVNAKYDERLRLYRRGERQWDTVTTLTMTARGVKPTR